MGRQRPTHRRDWRRLWRYCRCGYRWRCPDSLSLVPVPWPPPHLRQPKVTPDQLPEARQRPMNRGPISQYPSQAPLYVDQIGAMAVVVRAGVGR